MSVEHISEYIYTSNGEPLVNECGEVYIARFPKIVRCRDCKHYDIEERCCWFFAYYEEVGENEWERVPFEIEPTGFCVRGERRDA